MHKASYFDELINRKGSDCYKWDKNSEKFGTDDLIPLWVADLDFRSPPEVISRFNQRNSHGVFGYTFRSNKYFNAIIEWLLAQHNWQVSRDTILNTPGIVPGLNIAIQAFTQPGDGIGFLTPVYDPFFKSIENNNRKALNSDLIYTGNSYEIDFEDLEAKCRNAKMLFFCSPHNPVGRVWNRSELEQVGEICLRNDVMIISDEIHSDLIFIENKHIPLATLSKEISENTITFNAPSKTFNIAGLATSYAVIENQELRKILQNSLERLWLTSGNIFGMLALQTAYQQGREWLSGLLQYLQGNFKYLQEYFSTNLNRIRPVQAEGTYLAWLDCKNLDMKPQELDDLFINKAKVGLNNGIQYGEAGDGFMRLNFGCSRKILKTALLRIHKAVEGEV